MNKQETWDEKRQDTKWKGLTQGAKLCDSFFFFHIKKQETAPSYSVSSPLTMCLCSCAPQNESLYFSSRSCCSLAFYQLHQHIKFKNSKYTFYCILQFYIIIVRLLYFVKLERQHTASIESDHWPHPITFHIWIANMIHYFSFTIKNKFYSFKC
jgi:hypothetical protein